jgi:nitrite reductase/ring-hydroxylating ferredoxin subunit
MREYPMPMPFGWFQVAWSDEVDKGAAKPLFFFDKHLVAWRDDDGRAHVWDAFCPHMGAHLGVRAKIEGCEVVCPLHGWRYDSEGTCIDIPYSDRLNKQAKVGTYPVLERNGLLLAWYHPEGAAPMWDVPELPEFGEAGGFSEVFRRQYSLNCHWQEIAETQVDAAHIQAHLVEYQIMMNGGQKPDVVPMPQVDSYDTDGPVAKIRIAQDFPTPKGAVTGRIDTDVWGPGFAATWFTGLVDTLLLGCATPTGPAAASCASASSCADRRRRIHHQAGRGVHQRDPRAHRRGRRGVGGEGVRAEAEAGPRRRPDHAVPPLVRAVLRRGRRLAELETLASSEEPERIAGLADALGQRPDGSLRLRRRRLARSLRDATASAGPAATAAAVLADVSRSAGAALRHAADLTGAEAVALSAARPLPAGLLATIAEEAGRPLVELDAARLTDVGEVSLSLGERVGLILASRRRWSSWADPADAAGRGRRALVLGVALLAVAVMAGLVAGGDRGTGTNGSASPEPSPAGPSPAVDTTFENRAELRFSELPAYRGVAFADDLQAEQQQFTSQMLPGPGRGFSNPDFVGSYTNVVAGIRRSATSSCTGCPTVRVWLVGGSAAFGLGQRDEHTIASELVRLAAAQGIRLEVENHGVPGRTLHQEHLGVRERLDAGVPAPDLVISYGGYNDALGALAEAATGSLDPEGRNILDFGTVEQLATDGFALPDGFDVGEVAKVAAARYRRAQGAMDRSAAAAGAEVRYVLHPDALASSRQLAPVRDVYRGLPPWALGPASDMLDAMSRELRSDVIDLRHVFDDEPTSVFVDWAHTNELGAVKVAEALYAELDGTLRERAR